MSVTLQADAMYGEFREQVTLRCAALDHHLREILVEEYLLDFRIRIERHLDDLGLTIGVS